MRSEKGIGLARGQPATEECLPGTGPMANCLLSLVGHRQWALQSTQRFMPPMSHLGLFLLDCSNVRYGCGDTDRPLPVVV